MHIMKTKNQIQIADKAGISQGHLSKILSGKANPTMSTLEKVAAAMGIAVGTLIKRIAENKKFTVHGKAA